MTETVHPVDRLVGNNVRMLRTLRGISQSSLGEQVGVTFQQIQKYEKGVNRVSASMLFDIARVLDADVRRFFETAFAAIDDAGFVVPTSDTWATKLDLMIMQKLSKVRNVQVKQHLLALLDAMVEESVVGSDKTPRASRSGARPSRDA